MSVISKPKRSQTRITFQGRTQPRVSPGFADIVAVPITHDWGPINTATLVTSFQQFQEIFGDSDTDGRDAVLQASLGQNLLGSGGAGGVVVYRLAKTSGGGAAAKGTLTVNNTAGTPVAAVRIDALHEGERADLISVVVEADPNDVAKDRLRVLFNGATVESYSYAEADTQALADAVNDRPSSYITVARLAAGPLAATAATALASGADGTPVTATEWTAALNALEFENFSILGPANLTDSAIRAQLVAWTQQMNTKNRPVILVIGGASDDTISTALARSAAIADEHVINVGVGVYHDDVLDQDLSTAQVAPRVAGILAARGEEHSLTFARIAGLHHAVDGPNSDQIEQALDGGVVVFSRATADDADLKIERGLTTFFSLSDSLKPFAIFSEPRFIRVMDNFVRGMKEWGDNVVIGALRVDDNTRAAVRGEGNRRIKELRARGLIEAGIDDTTRPFIAVDPPADPSLSDAIPFDFGWQFTRTANYVLGSGSVL